MIALPVICGLIPGTRRVGKAKLLKVSVSPGISRRSCTDKAGTFEGGGSFRITRFEDPAARSFGVIACFRLWQSPEPLVATRVPKRLIYVNLLVMWESEPSWTVSSEHPLNGHSQK